MPSRMGAPAIPARHGTSTNLSPPERPKCFDNGIWSLASTFTAKCVAAANVAKLWLVLLADQRTSGGSSDTDENELAVMPTSLPSAAAVTTVTPVPNWPSERRNAAGSSLGSPVSSVAEESIARVSTSSPLARMRIHRPAGDRHLCRQHGPALGLGNKERAA